jgi:hypothetical protein
MGFEAFTVMIIVWQEFFNPEDGSRKILRALVNIYWTARRQIQGDSGVHRLKAFESRVLRRIVRSKRDEVTTGGRRKLHNGELHNLYSLPNIITVKGQDYVPCMGKWEMHIQLHSENLKRIHGLGDPERDGKVIQYNPYYPNYS